MADQSLTIIAHSPVLSNKRNRSKKETPKALQKQTVTQKETPKANIKIKRNVKSKQLNKIETPKANIKSKKPKTGAPCAGREEAHLLWLCPSVIVRPYLIMGLTFL